MSFWEDIVDEMMDIFDDLANPAVQNPVYAIAYTPDFMGSGGMFYFQGGGGGGSNTPPAPYDPSPGDGVYGLKIEFTDDGKIKVTAETDGWFDEDGDGMYDPGPVSEGGEVTVSKGWSFEADNVDGVLEFYDTFLPFEPMDVPIG